MIYCSRSQSLHRACLCPEVALCLLSFCLSLVEVSKVVLRVASSETVIVSPPAQQTSQIILWVEVIWNLHKKENKNCFEKIEDSSRMLSKSKYPSQAQGSLGKELAKHTERIFLCFQTREESWACCTSAWPARLPGCRQPTFSAPVPRVQCTF